MSAELLIAQGMVFGICQYVRDVNRLAFARHASGDAAPSNTQRIFKRILLVFRGEAETCSEVIEIAPSLEDGALFRLTDVDGKLDQRIEDGRQIERRAADDLEHIRCRRLLLQRLAQFGGARLHVLEQAHILDGDDCLVGEGFDQSDLTRTEGAGSLAQQGDRAGDPAAMEQRDSQRGAYYGTAERTEIRILCVCREIGNLNRVTFEDYPPGCRRAIDLAELDGPL